MKEKRKLIVIIGIIFIIIVGVILIFSLKNNFSKKDPNTTPKSPTEKVEQNFKATTDNYNITDTSILISSVIKNNSSKSQKINNVEIIIKNENGEVLLNYYEDVNVEINSQGEYLMDSELNIQDLNITIPEKINIEYKIN